MKFAVISLLPEMFDALKLGITGRAWQKGLIEIHCFNPRDFAKDSYRTVDDRPYGGGPGMVMLATPVLDAIAAAKQLLGENTPVYYLSAQGEPLKHERVMAEVKQANLILLCGRYEGIDERVMQQVDAEISIGDYVLSGGELPAMVFIDSLARQLPGSLGHAESASCDSFVDGILDFPHYTRPADLAGDAVPAVLLQGNHADIARYRQKQALGNTWLKRPELLAKQTLSETAQKLLDEFIAEQKT